jgi:hypothetical protein
VLEIVLIGVGAVLLKAAAFAPLFRLRDNLTHIEVDHGTIVTGSEDAPAWTFNMPKSRFNVEVVPEVMLTNGSGLVGYIDNRGTLRTESGHYDPLAGRVVTEPIGSLANVIDLAGRRPGEQ